MIRREIEVEILRLHHAERWPVGTIARELGVHRDVVHRVLRQEGKPQAIRRRPALVDPYLPFLKELLERHPKITAARLFGMCRERGYRGQPSHFRHLVSRLRPRRVEPFLRLKTLPAEEGQVDWAHFGTVRIGRAQRRLSAFALVLSWSRALYFRFYLSQKTEDFLRGHEAAFAFFQGVPRRLLYDNLKSAVSERIGDAIRFHPLLLDFAAHHRFEIRPVAVARGNEKGRVERAIRYVREAFFAARDFRDLAELNQQAEAFCRGPALERPWQEDRRRTVADALAEERAQLLPLPDTAFPTFERLEVTPRKQPYVRFDRNLYSIPPERVGRTLTLLADLEQVRVLFEGEVVAQHRRSFDQDEVVEDDAHVKALYEIKGRARRQRGMHRLFQAAPSTEALLSELGRRGENLGSATRRLLRLLDTHGAAALEEATREVLARKVPHVSAVAQVLEQKRRARGRPPRAPLSLPDDPRIRDLTIRPHTLTPYDGLADAPPGRSRDPKGGGRRT